MGETLQGLIVTSPVLDDMEAARGSGAQGSRRVKVEYFPKTWD